MVRGDEVAGRRATWRQSIGRQWIASPLRRGRLAAQFERHGLMIETGQSPIRRSGQYPPPEIGLKSQAIPWATNNSDKMDFRWHSWSISVDKVTTGPAGIRYSSALYDVPTRATFESSRGVCQQGIDNIGEIPGWPSWTRIEPCAWYHRRISGSCLRKSGRYPSRPGAETPARWRKRLVCMRPGRANRAFNQYRSLAPNAPPFLGRVSRLDRLLAGN